MGTEEVRGEGRARNQKPILLHRVIAFPFYYVSNIEISSPAMPVSYVEVGGRERMRRGGLGRERRGRGGGDAKTFNYIL